MSVAYADSAAGAALADHVATDASDAELAAEAARATGAEAGLDSRVDALEATAGLDTSPVFIGADAPISPPATYVWFETGLGDGTDFTLWIEDGA